MASPKRESPKTEDPMKRVKRPRSNPYENIVQELGFKKGIKYTSNTAKEHYKFTTGCDEKEAEFILSDRLTPVLIETALKHFSTALGKGDIFNNDLSDLDSLQIRK